jgi:hypothetical protein
VKGSIQIEISKQKRDEMANQTTSTHSPGFMISTMVTSLLSSRCSFFVIVISVLSAAAISHASVEVNVDHLAYATAEGEFSVESLVHSLSSTESLDLNAAIEMVSSPWASPDDQKALYFASIPTKQGNVPLLHHLFNLYQRFENQPQARYCVGVCDVLGLFPIVFFFLICFEYMHIHC